AAATVVVALITMANLRGLKESGTLFAVPTYGFILVVGAMIVTGLVRVATGSYQPPPPLSFPAEHSLTLFLLLRAFASGSTALTGVEAISNGVPAFRRPESRNAAATLTVLGVLLTFLFLGITVLADAYRVDPHLIEQGQTVTSQIARRVFGDGSALFLLTQVFTALILFLAANTSYADFPRLASILSRDRYLPVVLRSRGDKLAFSNGIVLLAVVAATVLWLYDASVHRIIPLYVIGVFASFTLSQLGMVVHWRRLRGPNWKRAAVVNGIGATTTFVALAVVGVVKFPLGAWQVILLIPAAAWLLRRVHVHYEEVGAALRAGPSDVRVAATRAVVLVSDSPGATTRAVTLARAFAPRRVHVVAFRVRERRLRAVRQRWADLGLDIPIEATGHRLDDLVEYVRGLQPSSAEPVTVVMSWPSHHRHLRQVVRNRALLRIRRALVAEPGVVVCSTSHAPAEHPPAGPLRGPVSLSIIVVVSAVHRAAFRALRYAQALRPTELVALSVALDPEDMHRLSEEWSRAGIDVPLEIVDSPFRSLVDPVLAEVRRRHPSPADAVGVVIPEPVVRGWRWKPLHGQRALLLKAALLFEPNVLVFDVPFHVGPNGGTRR
ncbi:MAG: APC family permease, partial [Actinomycetota bacterium]